jgi:hypothetical protein
MRLDLLTVELLREIARRHGFPTTGTKAVLIERLQGPTMPPTTLAAAWNLYTENRLDAFIKALGLDNSNANDKQAKCALLETVPGLTPNHALTAMMAHSQQGPRIELQLTKQSTTERADAFIARAKTHFQLVSASDNEAITLLVNAAQPPIAAFITENIQAGTTTKDEILRLVLGKFAPNSFQYYNQFSRFKLNPGQTAQEAGTELRRLYVHFLGYTKDQEVAHEDIIRRTVTARLLDALPLAAATTLRTELLREPAKTWDNILQLADHVLQVQPKSTATSTSATGRRERTLCKVHGLCTHTDAQCYSQKGGSQQANADQCFKCYQYGHAARDCPLATKKPGNAGTGSG